MKKIMMTMLAVATVSGCVVSGNKPGTTVSISPDTKPYCMRSHVTHKYYDCLRERQKQLAQKNPEYN